ncbi:MAG: cell division protein ZapB [Syntrophorhabdales bacterium]|jgi:septal ring factor EnvC (AmiA/AmiB activator)
MEELFTDNKLTELEEKIDALLGTYRGVKDEKESLTGRVGSLEAENRALREQLAKVENEKDLVMQKVKGILEKIQKIEA